MSKAVFCGTPRQFCCGSSVFMNAAWNPDGRSDKSGKVHRSHEEAFRCHAAYLVKNLGFVRVGSRGFAQDEESPIRILDKPSRFGAILRGGKTSEKGGNRFTPRHGRGCVV